MFWIWWFHETRLFAHSVQILPFRIFMPFSEVGLTLNGIQGQGSQVICMKVSFAIGYLPGCYRALKTLHWMAILPNIWGYYFSDGKTPNCGQGTLRAGVRHPRLDGPLANRILSKCIKPSKVSNYWVDARKYPRGTLNCPVKCYC